MSNPSEDGAETDGTGGIVPEVDSDPATEAIEVTVESDSGEPETGGRRYTAPGFDAGSTQIIDKLPDDETEVIDTPTQAFASTPRIRAVAPQSIPPRSAGRPRWLIPALTVLAAVVVAAVVGGVLVFRANTAKASQQNKVRSTIETFDSAVQRGDLATLRSVTCGQTLDNYAKYDDKSWAEAATRILAAQQYPVIASIDQVVVNGDHAEANVTSYMAFDPSTTSTRSFDLKFLDDKWKICKSS